MRVDWQISAYSFLYSLFSDSDDPYRIRPPFRAAEVIFWGVSRPSPGLVARPAIDGNAMRFHRGSFLFGTVTFKEREKSMRRILLALALVLALGAAPALDFPTKNITIIVPYGAGGATDLATRALVDSIPPGTLPPGVSFVITNMPGGSGLIGANFVANGRHDGYTLCGVTGDFLYSRAIGVTDLPLDTFQTLIWMQVDPYLILVKTGAYKSLKELVDYAKANPGKVKFGDSGPGAIPHLVGKTIGKATGADIRAISYDASLEAVIAVVNGEAEATALHSTAGAGQMRAGEAVPVAVTSRERSSLFPDVPTVAETFPGQADHINIVSTMSIAAPRDTPPEVVDYLRKVFTAAVNTDTYKEKLKLFQAQDISHYTVEDTLNLYKSLAATYEEMAK